MEEKEEVDDAAAVEEESNSELEQDNDVAWRSQAYVTGVNYHVKKMVFLLFINSASALVLKVRSSFSLQQIVSWSHSVLNEPLKPCIMASYPREHALSFI